MIRIFGHTEFASNKSKMFQRTVPFMKNELYTLHIMKYSSFVFAYRTSLKNTPVRGASWIIIIIQCSPHWPNLRLTVLPDYLCTYIGLLTVYWFFWRFFSFSDLLHLCMFSTSSSPSSFLLASVSYSIIGHCWYLAVIARSNQHPGPRIVQSVNFLDAVTKRKYCTEATFP